MVTLAVSITVVPAVPVRKVLLVTGWLIVMVPALSKEMTLRGTTLPTKPLKVMLPVPVWRFRLSAPAVVPLRLLEKDSAWFAVIMVTLPEITTGSLKVNVASPAAIMSAPTEILAPLVSITNGSITFILVEIVI